MAGQSDKVFEFQLNLEFHAFYNSVRKQHPAHTVDTLSQRILTLDPGETTGVTEYRDNLVTVYQWDTTSLGPSFNLLNEKLSRVQSFEKSRKFDMVRMEDYRIYEWKVDDHSWSPVHTLRLIGAFEAACHVQHTPHSYMLAQQAKKFWSDVKLDHFGMNPKGLRHGRDALRHLLYYILFPNSGKK